MEWAEGRCGLEGVGMGDWLGVILQLPKTTTLFLEQIIKQATIVVKEGL